MRFVSVETAAGNKCESCGQTARVRLTDGTLWCLSCDASARNLGYDDAPIDAWLD